ncbi:hypothetical protein HMPREF1984_00705 [Leptotrichia sp. oral taxon 215 str. W9775]|nr:hypothetical protein HMPREF1984_00705 [Leptotrichia sp. oral taxon 215 str. W9775]
MYMRKCSYFTVFMPMPETTFHKYCCFILQFVFFDFILAIFWLLVRGFFFFIS